MADPLRADPARDGTPDPFARLVQELQVRDYTRPESVTADIVSYTTATRSDLLATIERGGGSTGLARLAALAPDGSRRWEVTCTAAIPPPVQVLLLFAVLFADAGDEQDVLRSMADALSVDLDAEPVEPAAPGRLTPRPLGPRRREAREPRGSGHPSPSPPTTPLSPGQATPHRHAFHQCCPFPAAALPSHERKHT